MTDHRPHNAELDPSWTARYLKLLDVEHPGPSLEALTQLTRAHIERVLFGTVSSLLRKQAHPVGPMPTFDPAAQLDAWERGTGTGVCFEITEMVVRLLESLGYRVHVALGTIGNFWPGGHQGVIVQLDGRRYLVDVGNGAPLTQPIPLDETVDIWHVGLGYRCRPGDDTDHWVQERCIEGTWTPFCTYDLRPASLADREAGYQRHHVVGESWVVGSLLLVRCASDVVTVLRDTSLTSYTADGKHVETIEDESEYRRLATEVFGAPNLPIDEARAALALIRAATSVAT